MIDDVIVIGGGIVGLATALHILDARPNSRLTLIEKENGIAEHQTGHNSGVIHSGLYYKPGSQKAVTCRSGYAQLVQFCQEESIPHEICGKIVVATDTEELPRLEELHRRGLANGLTGLRYLSSSEISEVEPYCEGLRGLYVPQAGIVDYAVVAEKYAEKVVAKGGNIVLGERVIGIKHNGRLEEVIGESRTFIGKAVVSCAGLQSDRLALMTDHKLQLRILPFRGEYYQLKASAPKFVNHLIYPVPDPAFPFLGVHFTRMMKGGVECGPNAVLAFGREAYKKTTLNIQDVWESVRWPGFRKVARRHWNKGLEEYHRSLSKRAFVKSLQQLIPEIKAEHLECAGAGIRAQACDREGRLLDDFDIRGNNSIVHVCNAPSPAATASLAIGKVIADRIID